MTRKTVLQGTIIAAILAIASALRFSGLGDASLWFDEGFSLWFSRQDWSYLWRETPSFETHPPLFYSILKLATGDAPDEAMLRAPSALAGVIGCGMMFVLGRCVGGSRHGFLLGALGALLFACAPLALLHAREARPYPFLTLSMIAALAGAAWAISSAAAASPVARVAVAAATGLALALLPWFHNVGALAAASLGLFLCVWAAIARPGERGPRLHFVAAAGLVALAAYGPNLQTFLAQASAARETFWLAPPDAAGLLAIVSKVYLWSSPLLAVPLLAAGVAGFWRIAGAERVWLTALLMVGALAPFAAAALVSYLGSPILLPRTIIHAQPALFVIYAAAPLAFSGAVRLAAALGLLALAALGPVQAWRAEVTSEHGWRAIAASIEASAYADAPVLVSPNSAALALAPYAERAGLSLYPVPGPYPVRESGRRYPSGGGGEPMIEGPDADRAIEAASGAPAVWRVSRLDGLYDPRGEVACRLAVVYACRRLVHDDPPLRAELYTARPCDSPTPADSRARR